MSQDEVKDLTIQVGTIITRVMNEIDEDESDDFCTLVATWGEMLRRAGYSEIADSFIAYVVERFECEESMTSANAAVPLITEAIEAITPTEQQRAECIAAMGALICVAATAWYGEQAGEEMTQAVNRVFSQTCASQANS